MTDTKRTTTMLNEDFAAIARAGIRISGNLLDTISVEQQHAIEGALQGGARLVLEFGPLPAFETLQLVLLEREGRRHTVATVALNKVTMQ